MAASEGWHGWDEYAAFYDWENARTLGRRDVRFWQDLVRRVGGPVLELGCGTGRVTVPLGRTGVPVVGIDRSEAMLTRGRQRARRTGLRGRVALVRGDVRALPFARRAFRTVVAPYGVLQSLLREDDLAAALRSAADVLPPGGRLGIDLVPDVPRWQQYERRVTHTGRRGLDRVPVTLTESVRQDRRRRLTVFEHEFAEGRGRARRVSRFSLTFRTVAIPTMLRRLERAGFRVDAILGDYQGGPLRLESDAWIILATRS